MLLNMPENRPKGILGLLRTHRQIRKFVLISPELLRPRKIAQGGN